MKKSTLICLTCILSVSCTPVSKIYVLNVKNVSSLENTSQIYSLPRTVIKVTVKVQKASFIPGPYHAYADKYLGIKDVKGELSFHWELSELFLDSFVEPDPENTYILKSVNKNKDYVEFLQNLDNLGMILLPDKYLSQNPIHENYITGQPEIHYTDLSVKRNLVIEKETVYKRVMRDSIYLQIPEVKEERIVKKLETRAEEAANFIIKLRKRRFKMLTGQSETHQIDVGIEDAVKELNRIEDEYISLFTGKTEYEEITGTYEYYPLLNKKSDQVILFRISDTEGLIDAKIPAGKPVVLEINSKNLTEPFSKFNSELELENDENTVFYRLPETSVISLKKGEEFITGGKITIFQHGTLVGMKIN